MFFIFWWLCLEVMLLPNKRFQVRFLVLPRCFSPVVELLHGICKLGVHGRCPYFQWRTLHFADCRSGERYQLCLYLYMLPRVTSFTTGHWLVRIPWGQWMFNLRTRQRAHYRRIVYEYSMYVILWLSLYAFEIFSV